MKFLGVSCRPHVGITMWSQSVLRTCRHCVVGVGDIGDANNGFGGLRHRVFVDDNGVLYNWGTQTRLADVSDRPCQSMPRHNTIVHVLELRR